MWFPHVMVKSAHLFCLPEAELPVLSSSFPLASYSIWWVYNSPLPSLPESSLYMATKLFQIANLAMLFSHLNSFSFFSLLTRQIQISNLSVHILQSFLFFSQGYMTSQIHIEIYAFLSLPMIFLFPGLASPLCLPHKY